MTMNLCKCILLWVSLATLAACSAMPTTQSGFLSQPSQSSLTTTSGEDNLEVIWKMDVEHDITPQEQAELKAVLKRELEFALAQTKSINKLENIKVRAAITRIEAVSPALNWFTTILLFVPMDHGGAAVEMEAVNVRSNKVITQLRFASWTPISELKAHFTRLAPANLALTAAAHEFVGQLVGVSEY